MIVVTVEKHCVVVAGHSGYDESGKDIVCAGASTLLQSLIRSITDLTEDKIEYSLVPGSGMVCWENLSEQGKLLVDSFFVGICMMAEEYPEYIRVA